MIEFLQRAAGVAFLVVVMLGLPDQLERRVAPEPAPRARHAEPWPAPVWSRRCAEQGRTYIAHQADGGPWRVPCTGAKRT